MLAQAGFPLFAGDDAVGDWVDVLHICFTHISLSDRTGLPDGGYLPDYVGQISWAVTRVTRWRLSGFSAIISFPALSPRITRWRLSADTSGQIPWAITQGYQMAAFQALVPFFSFPALSPRLTDALSA